MTSLRYLNCRTSSLILLLSALCLASRQAGAAEGKPLRALLITGGCCHEYGRQKDILKSGLEARLNIVVDQIHTDDTSTRPPLPFLGNPDYAKGYDLVIHDECGSSISEPAIVEGVLAPHRAGIPGVNLHCAMHSYRTGDPNQPATPGTPHALWFEYLGLQSSGHGPQKPISITFTHQESPLVRGFTNWTTANEELYNNIRLFDNATPLARGEQKYSTRSGAEKTDNFVVVWTNLYGPAKTRVFSTTLGHNTVTVADGRYLDLVARGILWATGHLNEDGSALPGYTKPVAP